jgi:hypothetical protein
MPLQAAFLVGCNSTWCLPYELTIIMNVVLILPAVWVIATQHCMRAELGELAALARTAARIRPWIFALSPMAGAGLGQGAEQPAPLQGTQACVALHAWLPIIAGQVAPTAVLVARQLAWRADFQARREAQRPRRPRPGRPPHEFGATWTPFHACTLLLAMACVLWMLVEFVVVKLY